MSEPKRKIKKNRSRKALKKKQDVRRTRIKVFFQASLLVLFTALLSIVFMAGYGWVIGSDSFGTKFIIVSGTRRLNEGEILRQAEIQTGINIVRVNLKETRERLISHPWVRNAEVIRQFPDRLLIRIEEHKPTVVFDLGDKYLVNNQGEIFKKYEGPFALLPVVKGLPRDSVIIAGLETPRRQDRLRSSVMELIRIRSKRGHLFPGGTLREITADPDLGLTARLTGPVSKIKLGFGEYEKKLERLSESFEIMNKKINMPHIDTIDLNDINRVVVKPATT